MQFMDQIKSLAKYEILSLVVSIIFFINTLKYSNKILLFQIKTISYRIHSNIQIETFTLITNIESCIVMQDFQIDD